MISKRVQRMDASGIRKAFEAVQQGKDIINLSIGQPDFEIPQNIKDAACEAIQKGKNQYTVTQGIEPLRKAIAKKLSKEKQLYSKKENILITGAVSGGLSIILPVILDTGDEVLLFDPCFVGYKQLVLLFGAKPKQVRKNDDFSINFTALERAVTKKTKAIILSDPENPTGYVYTKEEIVGIADFARKHDLYVISDEIYVDFIYEKKHFSIGTLYDKTILLRGFSKSHGMMGFRIGYLSAPEEIIVNAKKVQQFTFVCAPTPFQYGAIEALQTPVKDTMQQFKKRRDLIYDGLKDLYEMNMPNGAFYFYIRYPYEGKRFIEKCLKHNLIVVPGSSFSEKDTHFRITYTADEHVLKRAITVLRTIAKSESP